MESQSFQHKGTDFFTELKTLSLRNPKHVVVGHLNINSHGNEFESLKSIITPIGDVFLVSETKICESWNGKQNNFKNIELYKFLTGLSPPIKNEVFQLNEFL